METQQEVIKKLMAALDNTTLKGSAAVDDAIKACSNFKSTQEVINKMVADCKNAKSADDFLKTYCGIDYSTKDNGAITGSDAGGSKAKTEASIIPESGSLKTYKKTSFTKKGLTVKLGDGKTYNQLSASEKFIWNGLYTWWVEGALNLIEESYGSNFGFGKNSSATVKEMSVCFYTDKNSSTLASTSSSFDDKGKTYTLRMDINMSYWNSLENNLSKANSEFDSRVVAHELTHAVMHTNIDGYVHKSLPGFVQEGVPELTYGIENFRKSDIQNLAKNSSSLSKALVLDTNTVAVSGINNPSYSGGYMFLRYLTRQSSDFTIENTTDKSVQTFYGNDNVTNFVSAAKIITGAGKDSIYNWDWDNTKVTIDSGSGNDVIANVGASTTIDGVRAMIQFTTGMTT